MKIRPLNKSRDSDYEALARIERAADPDSSMTVELFKYYDAAVDPKYAKETFVAETDSGEIVAFSFYLESWGTSQPGKFFLDIKVHPDYQGQGTGQRMGQHLMEELAAHNPQMLAARTREDWPRGIQFLEAQGFTLKMRNPVSRLDVNAFDPARFADTLTRTQEAGIRLTTLDELIMTEGEDTALRKTWELDCLISPDIPSSDAYKPLDFDFWIKRFIERPTLLRNGWFIAVDGAEYVGLSVLWQNSALPTRLNTGLTGVRRSHRRMGIATSLKVKAIEYAKRYGAHDIETHNADTNPMYQINLDLGFRPCPAKLDYEKHLETT